MAATTERSILELCVASWVKLREVEGLCSFLPQLQGKTEQRHEGEGATDEVPTSSFLVDLEELVPVFIHEKSRIEPIVAKSASPVEFVAAGDSTHRVPRSAILPIVKAHLAGLTSAVNAISSLCASDGRESGTIALFDLAMLVEKSFAALPREEQRKCFDTVLLLSHGSTVVDLAAFVQSMKQRLDRLVESHLSGGKLTDIEKRQRDLTKCYIKIQNRCLDTTPSLREPVTLPTDSEGFRAFAKAERTIVTALLGSAWDDSCSAFERAATILRGEGEDFAAGNAFVRCGDCRRFLMDPDGEAGYYLRASQCYQDAGYPHDSIEALVAAMDIYRTTQPNKISKLNRQCSELFVSVGECEKALELLLEAADLYKAKEYLGDARATLREAIDVTVTKLVDYGRGIDLLEKLFDFSPEFDQPRLLFRAIVLRLVCVPPEHSVAAVDAMADVKETMDEYCSVCPQFLDSPERALLLAIINSLDNVCPETIEEAVAKYMVCHTLEPWVIGALHGIHSNSLEKKGAVEMLFHF